MYFVLYIWRKGNSGGNNSLFDVSSTLYHGRVEKKGKRMESIGKQRVTCKYSDRVVRLFCILKTLFVSILLLRKESLFAPSYKMPFPHIYPLLLRFSISVAVVPLPHSSWYYGTSHVTRMPLRHGGRGGGFKWDALALVVTIDRQPVVCAELFCSLQVLHNNYQWCSMRSSVSSPDP